MASIPVFQPSRTSILRKSPEWPALAKAFSGCVNDMANGRIEVEEAAAELCDIDPALPEKKVIKELRAGLKKFSGLARLHTGIDPQEVNAILSNETRRAENIAGIRSGAAELFVRLIRNLLEDPERFEEMDPKKVGEWYRLVRMEEDREREIMLKAKAEAREDAKFKLMFFDFISGSLGQQDIEFLDQDLKNDLIPLLNANPDQSSRRVLEGAAFAPSSPSAE